MYSKNCGSSIGIAASYGLDTQGIRVRCLKMSIPFSLLHGIQTNSRAHQAFYPTSTERLFSPGVKQPRREGVSPHLVDT